MQTRLRMIGSVWVFLCVIITGSLNGDSEVTAQSVLAKARQRLGGAERLDAITSIRYEGTFVQHGVAGEFQSFVQKPNNYYAEYDDGRVVTITGFDGFTGWHHIIDRTVPANSTLQLLTPEENRRLRYNTYDNLFMYSNLDRVRGEARYEGKVIQDGFQTHRIGFFYNGELIFHRYFDVDDGSLIATINPEGIIVREFGTLMVDGIRFPRRVVASFEGDDVSVLQHERIVLNEVQPESLFEVPTPPPPQIQSGSTPTESPAEAESAP